MKTKSVIRGHRLHAHTKGKNYLYAHEGRRFALMTAAVFVAGVMILWGLAMLAS